MRKSETSDPAARFLEYTHVDVFASAPFSGNSLPVFIGADGLTGRQQLTITQELRHFEAVFLQPTPAAEVWRARVFDLSDELPFAGHPLLGAAAVLHRRADEAMAVDTRVWDILLPDKEVRITTRRCGLGWHAVIDQGMPEFLGILTDREAVAGAFDLEAADLQPGLPVEVVSTGLRYLIVPVRRDVLHRARIVRDISPLVRAADADFAVLLDEESLEIRHWNNDGVTEDIATGSAAGTIGAYRLRHDLAEPDRRFALNQGRFVGRPSTLTVEARGTSEHVETVLVGGQVSLVGFGCVQVPER